MHRLQYSFAVFVSVQLLFAPALFADGFAAEDGMADTIWVRKSERILYLLKDYRIIRSYPISLGKNPRGHKLAEGDMRTPEGVYFIDWRNPDSKYHMALHISYPNQKDVLRAAYEGVDAGGAIMVHGYPDTVDGSKAAVIRLDWTDGCIALRNHYVEEIWQLVADGTPILIDP